MRYNRIFVMVLLAFSACRNPEEQPSSNQPVQTGKIVIYQVFTRLFGNTNSTNKPWGTIEENGVGKFNDFTDTALAAIKDLGVTHIWYTGIPHHALVRDYTKYGISNDDPDVVKGRAGSPYAVKDYYNVNPDLAVDPARRLEEFKALVDRTHRHGLKVIIDIVPNHVARHYASLNKPDSVADFGENDDKSLVYHRDNSFYYIPGEDFKVPASSNGYKPLGGESHPLSDGKFDESPAKWTGNGSRLAQPGADDWYETVKINYGISPDGTKDFDSLPPDYRTRSIADHQAFWNGKNVPASWKKFRDIALFWLNLGVDGFRFDMAEMVPVEFWSYMNSAIKTRNPGATLVAEVYNPAEYRNYIQLGKMDYLYDKVELYDTLKHIMQGHGSTDNLVFIQKGLADIEHHMLHFLENHDEQRIASPGFAGNAEKGKPAMVVSALISTSPTLIYFGQELGEPGAEDAGFGKPTRTSIFDYVGVPHHQRWMNGGKFDGGQSSPQEKDLRAFYQRLLKFTTGSSALMGSYAEIHTHNRQNSSGYDKRLFSFVRWSDQQKIIVFANFSADKPYEGVLKLPSELISDWGLKDGTYTIHEKLSDNRENKMVIKDGTGTISIKAMPLESQIWSYE
ncbi:alpha-amylase family protein [Flavihumibacter stibioxidans]|uniref:Alpha-amylase n=1 Tax=Flavihumibacter stibioxidans TaxID=1834163 RepID=A0ABR7M417_9BACT|nr:alpha-amylase family protein [Flavihumibacter stibioxidans]MBC6489766.1 alpha-amylase [Flavihumibacter stibioxidans]